MSEQNKININQLRGSIHCDTLYVRAGLTVADSAAFAGGLSGDVVGTLSATQLAPVNNTPGLFMYPRSIRINEKGQVLEITGGVEQVEDNDAPVVMGAATTLVNLNARLGDDPSGVNWPNAFAVHQPLHLAPPAAASYSVTIFVAGAVSLPFSVRVSEVTEQSVTKNSPAAVPIIGTLTREAESLGQIVCNTFLTGVVTPATQTPSNLWYYWSPARGMISVISVKITPL